MNFEQAATLLTSLHEQATGQSAIAPTDESSFVSMAQATLRSGYDPIINAISQMIGRTLIAVRPYTSKLAGLEKSADEWGGIIRKINFIEGTPENEQSYNLTDGSAIDQYIVKKPKVLETHYYGRAIYSDTYTLFTDMLKTAFESSSEFSRFFSGLMQHFANQREQWLEDLKRGIVSNFIAAKYTADGGTGDMVVHLLTEYNAATGGSYTAITIKDPANFAAFTRWMYARVNTLARMMSERSEKFQQRVTGKPILRHTPAQDLKCYLLAEFKDQIDAMALSVTYNDNYLKLADNEGISFWQAIEAPDEIKVTPAYVDSDLAIATASAVTLTDVVGVLFDRDACGYNIYRDTLETSPYNARGSYYNMFPHVEVQLQNDITEKGVVLLLD
jgi:hypothetical protein